MANKELEHAIFVELSVFDDFKEFFIAVSTLKEALKEEDLKDLGKVVSNDLFVKRFGERATTILVVDIETERVLNPYKAPSCQLLVSRVLSGDGIGVGDYRDPVS